MSHAVHHDPTVPRGALVGTGVLLAFVLMLTASVRLGILPHAADPAADRAAARVAAAETRALRFTDRDDGAVVIADASTGEVIKVVEPNTGGFLRATVRRMAKARAAAGVGAEPPFTLTRWENGALSLTDPTTGKQAEIYGFGADHVRIFAELLKDGAA